MKRKNPPQTPHPSQNQHGKARGNEMHSHSHRHERRVWQPLPKETSLLLDKLRFQYKDKIIEKRSFESYTYGYCEYNVYPNEYYEKELEVYCGDMEPEQAANYLETVGRFSLALLKRLDTVRAFQYIKALGHTPESREYTERVIAENPGTPIALEARYYLADVLLPWGKEFYSEKAQAYREILEIEPNSINALLNLGSVLMQDDKPAEAIPYLKRANRLNPKSGFFTLGEANEKLGDVKTAWTYYKKAIANGHPQSWIMRRHIEAIESGNPLHKPLTQEHQQPIPSPPIHLNEHTSEHHSTQEQTYHTEILPNDVPLAEPDSTIPSDIRVENAEKRRAAAKAAQQAYHDLQKHQERKQKELQKELNDFLQWTATIINAESPMDTNNFLMKEMEAHLKGGQAQFEPERIIRAFETMERYGAAGGIKRLQKVDPELARQIQRLLSDKRTLQQHQQKRSNK